MADLRLVTYCGLYCGLCSANCRIPERAMALREAMRKDGYEHWAPDAMPGFTDFWTFLEGLAEPEAPSSCRDETCGASFCTIRTCARERSVDVCPSCDDYPCHRIEALARGYPTLLHDAKRMKEIGIEAWIEEQEERAATGFAYTDIRCYPYEVPRD